ncbi:hypothetical protein HDU98_005920, partial [Podochytrium sp. JEL0797]
MHTPPLVATPDGIAPPPLPLPSDQHAAVPTNPPANDAEPDPQGVSHRTRGFVKFFNAQKGYGFIIPLEGELEVFVHHTAILRPDGGF